MPTWAKWLAGLITIGVILIGVCGIMLIVLLVKGHTMGETVTQATESIQDLSALESIMPMMLNLLQALYNNSNVIPQEIFGASGFDNPVPQVNYINILNDSVRMAYRFSGLCSNPETPVVVLVHALSSSSVEWISEMLLYGQESMCAIAVDLVGHGNSDPTNEQLGGTVTNQAMYLFEFLYQLGILANSSRTVIAVGSNFGGSVVVQMLDNYPGIADSMILVNPVPYLVKPGDPNATQSAVTGAGSVQSFVELAGLSLYNASAYTGLMSLAIVSGSSCSPDALEPVVEAYQQVAISGDPGAISQGLISLASMDHTSALENGIIPVLMITGAKTGLEAASSLNYALLAEQARNIVGRLATLHVIGSASGAVHITHRTLFHTLSQQFLSGLDSTCDPASIAWSHVE
jgi:pimeloyl-ACP methyl ester carboxylesterase